MIVLNFHAMVRLSGKIIRASFDKFFEFLVKIPPVLFNLLINDMFSVQKFFKDLNKRIIQWNDVRM